MRKVASFFFLISVFVLNCTINEAVAGSSFSKSSFKSSVYYHYFKEKIPLSIDQEQIAIEQRPNKKVDLDSFGISSKKDFEQTIGSDLSLRKFKLPKKHEEVINIIPDIAENKDVEFISPVFRTKNNDKIIFKKTIKIGFKANISEEVREQIIVQIPMAIVQNRNWGNRPNVYLIRTNKKSSLEVLEIANQIAQLPEVEFAEPGMVTTVKLHYIPNDPGFEYCWGLHNTGQDFNVTDPDGTMYTVYGIPDVDMDAPEAWDITHGDASIVVAVLDTGVQQNHPDIRQIKGRNFFGLDPNIPSSWDGTSDGGPVTFWDNHGTAVAGCISGDNNALGTIGIAHDCKIVSLRIMENIGPTQKHPEGELHGDPDNVIMALTWATYNGIKITCNSWASPYSGDVANMFYSTRTFNNMTHFAAVLNPKDDPVTDSRFPANCESVIGVQAVYNDANRFGLPGSEVELSAPGFAIYTTDRTDPNRGYDGESDYIFQSGTSFACPYAAGVAALLLSIDNTLTPVNIDYILSDSAVDLGDPGYDQDFGFGLVNAYEALQYVIPVSLTVTIEPSEVVADARWKLNTGPDTSWKGSGETISGLEEGYPYVLSFNSVSGYAQPPSRGFTPGKGQNFETVTYAVSYGGVKVNISPQEAIDAGAQWRVEGMGWRNSGETESGLAPGTYTIQFKPIDLWFAPEDTIVNVIGGMTATQNSDYVEGASFQVFITPDVPDTARWRLTNGDDTNWKRSGEKIDLVYVGRNYLEFKNIPDWDELAIQEVNPVTGGNIRNVRFSYNPKKIIITGLNSDNQTDIPEDSNEYIGLSAGKYHNVAVKSDGSLIGWGKNDQGQCNIPTGTFIEISAGTNHSLAIRTDGTLAAWGDNNYGQINTPSGNNYIAVSAGEYHSVALKNDGSIVAWGQNDFGQCNIPSGSFGQVEAGDYFNVAIKTDGSLHAWGNNDYGQCNVPSGSNYNEISAGGSHAIAIKSDGSLAAWGQNTSGQCNIPQGNNYVSISAGYKHSIALTSESSAVAWGNNTDGQCDIPEGNNYSIIAAGGYHSVVLKKSIYQDIYHIVGWGNSSCGQADSPTGADYISIKAWNSFSVALKENGSIIAWGCTDYGKTNPPTGNNYIEIGSGRDYGLALKDDGSIVGWGLNNYNQATPPAGNDYMAIAAGASHAIALKSDGSIDNWGFASSSHAAPPGHYVAVDAGDSHNIALKSDGSLTVWGPGIGGYGLSNVPDGNDFVAITAGYNHCLALKNDGSIVGWGRDDYGQATAPTGNDYLKIQAGVFHSLALKGNGTIVGWGKNDSGQATCPSGENYAAIAGGFYHSLALKKYKCMENPDIDSDGKVNFNDFAILASYWLSCDGTCLTSCCNGADLNSDEIVDFDDLGILAYNWLFSSLTEGLIAYYPFDGNNDDIIGGHGGVWNGGDFVTDGIKGQAYNFSNGIYFTAGTIPEIDNVNQLTVAIWFKGRNTYWGGAETVVCKGNYTEAPAFQLWFSGEDNPQLYNIQINAVGAEYNSTEPYYVDNLLQWHHYALVYDGNKAKAYVDGLVVDETTADIGYINTTGHSLYINRHTWLSSGSSSRLEGQVDEFRVYNRALSDLEIQQLYNLE